MCEFVVAGDIFMLCSGNRNVNGFYGDNLEVWGMLPERGIMMLYCQFLMKLRFTLKEKMGFIGYLSSHLNILEILFAVKFKQSTGSTVYCSYCGVGLTEASQEQRDTETRLLAITPSLLAALKMEYLRYPTSTEPITQTGNTRLSDAALQDAHMVGDVRKLITHEDQTGHTQDRGKHSQDNKEMQPLTITATMCPASATIYFFQSRTAEYAIVVKLPL